MSITAIKESALDILATKTNVISLGLLALSFTSAVQAAQFLAAGTVIAINLVKLYQWYKAKQKDKNSILK